MEANSFKDNRRIVSYLTVKRLFNLILLFASYQWSNITRKPLRLGLPFSLDFEPTTSCNLGCPECPSGLKKFTRPMGSLSPELFQNTINSVKEHAFYLMFYFQGEPFIHKQFLEMVKMAKKARFYVATSTNGHFINEKNVVPILESGIDRLIISIDGIGQDVYEKYRVYGDYEKVIKATRLLIENRKAVQKPPFIIWQFIVFAHNEHQIEEIKTLGKELGVDQVRIKSAQLYDPTKKEDWKPKNKKYSRYASEFKLKNQCWRIWHASVVTWDGKVLPCCYDKDAQYQLGQIGVQSLPQIQNNNPTNGFINQIYKNRRNIDICTNCGEGVKVWRK